MRLLSRVELSAVGGCAVVVLLQAIAAAPAALEYRVGLWLIEPWRLVGAHLVHINWRHAALNCAAWWLIARLFQTELTAARHWIALAAGALATDAGLALLYPSIAWYRGASAVLHSLYFAGAVLAVAAAVAPGIAGERAAAAAAERDRYRSLDWRRLWLPAVLLTGGAVKVVLEQPGAAATPFAEWLGAPTVPQAHWLGAVAGAALGAAWVLAGRRRSRKVAVSRGA